MRTDMSKVVTEKPRLGSSSPSIKTGARVRFTDEDADYGPTRHPISRLRQYGWEAKTFSDVLGPLRRFFMTKVGTPWNDVYSELSVNLDRRTMSGRHIWSHVEGEVEQHVRLINGVPFTVRFLMKINGFYVHPITGLLCFVPGRRFHKWKPREDPNIKKIGEGRELHRIDGIRYLVVTTQVEEYVTKFDYRLRVFLTSRQMVSHVHKKQLSKKEKKAFKLSS